MFGKIRMVQICLKCADNLISVSDIHNNNLKYYVLRFKDQIIISKPISTYQFKGQTVISNPISTYRLKHANLFGNLSQKQSISDIISVTYCYGCETYKWRNENDLCINCRKTYLIWLWSFMRNFTHFCKMYLPSDVYKTIYGLYILTVCTL